jgi:hypothetical protein
MSFTEYKIRDPKTGLFQTGGTSFHGGARWSKRGKTWSTIGHLKQHLTLLREHSRYQRYGRTVTDVPDPVDPTWELVQLVYPEPGQTGRPISEIL